MPLNKRSSLPRSLAKPKLKQTKVSNNESMQISYIDIKRENIKVVPERRLSNVRTHVQKVSKTTLHSYGIDQNIVKTAVNMKQNRKKNKVRKINQINSRESKLDSTIRSWSVSEYTDF